MITGHSNKKILIKYLGAFCNSKYYATLKIKFNFINNMQFSKKYENN